MTKYAVATVTKPLGDVPQSPGPADFGAIGDFDKDFGVWTDGPVNSFTFTPQPGVQRYDFRLPRLNPEITKQTFIFRYRDGGDQGFAQYYFHPQVHVQSEITEDPGIAIPIAAGAPSEERQQIENLMPDLNDDANDQALTQNYADYFGGWEAIAAAVAPTVLGTFGPLVDPTNPTSPLYPHKYASIHVQNNAPKTIWFAILESNELQGSPGAPTVIIEQGEQYAQGWWRIEPGETAFVLKCRTRVFYWYAETRNSRWSGNYYRRIRGRKGTIAMRRIDMGSSYRKYHPYRIPLVL